MMLLLMALISESGAAILYDQFVLKHLRFAVWDPSLDEVEKSWRDATAAPDPELGWPPPSLAHMAPYDASGAKDNPDFPDPARACASAYGDSFVWGDEVPLTEGWIEQLSRLIHCRISNYAVTGYGTDQAFIRFRRNADEAAPVILLGIYAQDVMRNVNQYRAFIGFGITPHEVKGRFVLDEKNSLKWIPRPQLDRARFIELNSDPARIVPQDALLPGGDYGPVVRRFSFTWTLLSLELARLRGRPLPIAAFLNENDPSQAFALTLALVKSFRDLAQQRHKKLLVVMLPDAVSLRNKRRSGSFEYDRLRDRIGALGIATFDVGPGLLSARTGKSYCDLFARPNCEGHYSVEGDRLVAGIMASELARRGFLPTALR
ncbi:MAG TPA: hypothetical protein VKV77_05425 [Methylovirgula sp.]|nr:hypothetical protein [Methylovirgula sp.]